MRLILPTSERRVRVWRPEYDVPAEGSEAANSSSWTIRGHQILTQYSNGYSVDSLVRQLRPKATSEYFHAFDGSFVAAIMRLWNLRNSHVPFASSHLSITSWTHNPTTIEYVVVTSRTVTGCQFLQWLEMQLAGDELEYAR